MTLESLGTWENHMSFPCFRTLASYANRSSTHSHLPPTTIYSDNRIEGRKRWQKKRISKHTSKMRPFSIVSQFFCHFHDTLLNGRWIELATKRQQNGWIVIMEYDISHLFCYRKRTEKHRINIGRYAADDHVQEEEKSDTKYEQEKRTVETNKSSTFTWRTFA